MQYILTEEEYKGLLEYKTKLDSAKEIAVEVLRNMCQERNGCFKQVPKSWLWQPIDGNTYLYASEIAKDFREELERILC